MKDFEIKDKLSIRTYFLDAYYRYVKGYKISSHQLSVSDYLRTYVRVLCFDKPSKTAVICNFLEDYKYLLVDKNPTNVFDKIVSRYEKVRSNYLKYFDLEKYDLIYDIWELTPEPLKDIMIKAIDLLKEKSIGYKVNFIQRSDFAKAIKILYTKIPEQIDVSEYNKFIISLQLNKIGDLEG